MRFRKGVVEEITARAQASDDEVCGLLLGAPDEVVEAPHCRNVAADPAGTFEIDPAQLIAALRAARAGGRAVVGCYHSHPSGSAEPSARDAADAEPNGWLWLIVAAEEASLWRAVPNGRQLGRFDPVPFSSPAPLSSFPRPRG